MAGFTDTLRGDGLARAQRALAGLEGDPLQLDVARRRFSHSPLLYTSDRSGTTTQSASPEPPSEQQRRKRRVQLGIEREREASRLYFQFVYQISKERERIQDGPRSEECATTADINSRAYENVKATWIKRGIWNRKWGILPGMSWKHEEPLQEETDDGPASTSADLRVNAQLPAGHEEVEAPPRRIFGSPSPVEPPQPRESGIANASQPVNIDSVSIENGDTKHTPSASNSPHTRIEGQVLRPIIGQASRRSNRKLPQKAQPGVNEFLGPVQQSKISKAARKSRHVPQRRLNVSKKASFGSLPLSSDVDTSERQPSPIQAFPRRSQRIKPPVPSVATDQIRTASTDISKPSTWSKPERNVAKNVTTRRSTKPRGISKRQSPKTTRGKAGKE